jgi:plasmid stabilization system protein ParE
MKVRFSRLALAELETILTDIRSDDPRAAARVGERVRRVTERLRNFPKVRRS